MANNDTETISRQTDTTKLVSILNAKYKLNANATEELAKNIVNVNKAGNNLEKLSNQVSSYSKDLKKVPLELGNQFKEARKQLSSYKSALYEGMKNISIDDETRRTASAATQGVRMRANVLDRYSSGIASTASFAGTEESSTNAIKAQTKAQTSVLKEQQVALQKAMNLEKVQVLMQGISQAASIISQKSAIQESNLRTIASDRLQQGDWHGTVAALKEAQSANKNANTIEGGMNTANMAIAGAQLGSFLGPWGAAAGAAIGGIWGFLSELERSEAEQEQYNIEIAKARAAIVQSSFAITSANRDRNNAIVREKRLSEPIANRDKIEEKAKHYRDIANKSLKESNIIADEIRMWQDRAREGELDDAGTQRLIELQNRYKLLDERYNRYDKYSKEHFAAVESADAELARREEERKAEENAIASGNKDLLLSRTLRDEQTTRDVFAETLNEVAKKQGDEAAAEYLNNAKTDVEDGDGVIAGFNQFYKDLSDTIEAQTKRADEINKEIKVLDKSRRDGLASSEDIQKQISLEKEYADYLKQIESDTKLLNANELTESAEKAKQEKAKKDATETYQTYNAATTSQYLSENLGSFSRYFGKTDPIISLTKESNEILRGILNSIKTMNDGQVSRYE